MQDEQVRIVSIHDRVGLALAFDLKDILHPLSPKIDKFRWWVNIVDCVPAESCQKVAHEQGTWLSSKELTSCVSAIDQTIDAVLLGFPADVDPREVSCEELELGSFPHSRAELAIVAVDSSFFEVYCKRSDIIGLLKKRFKDVREERAESHFS